MDDVWVLFGMQFIASNVEKLYHFKMFTSKPAFRIKNKTSKSYRNTAVSKKLKDKPIINHVKPSCFNVIRPLKKDIQIPVPSSRF
ncbi:transcriptional co-activator mating type protein alpha [Saccharomyces paradoxus]|uniref:Transcriptional co-activator mating type protein alpha n=1 Tax=Saccharomyces paradoxus TaxID=27291 RepID=A0A8B8UMJ8_SACPA|nr:Matalpha1 [Saccharomyces paradoxus]QHS71950.1 Matalpha1 [Saccharomyces paradoxus]